MDEFRVSNSARWISNFTSPTSPVTTDANTKLLLHFDGDESSGNHSISFNNGSSMNSGGKFDGTYYFDGTNDYLSLPDSNDWSFGTGDFTIDFWTKSSGNNEFATLL